MSDTSYTWDVAGAEAEPVNPAHLDAEGNWTNSERAEYTEESFDVTQPPAEDGDAGDPDAAPETPKRGRAKADDSASA